MQILWISLSIFIYIGVSLFDYKILLHHAHYIYVLCIGLLLLTFTPLGVEIFGSRRWIDLKVLLFQPAEAAKTGTLIMIASLLARYELGTVKESITVLTKVAITAAIPSFLIFMQPDLGSTLIFPPLVFALLYISKLSIRFFISVFAVFILFIGILSVDVYSYHLFLKQNNLSALKNAGEYQKQSWLPLKDYQRNRILAFAAPEVVDPQGIGVSWNLRQSLISVGSGGFKGKGWMEGTQAKLGYLPQSVAHNDFIFSVLAEEKGFAGSLVVIALYVILCCNGVRIASLARDRFGMLLAVGISVIFIVHTFINVGMTIGLMPITGIPLPFLSYGGSFLINCCLLQGFIQSIYRHRKNFS